MTVDPREEMIEQICLMSKEDLIDLVIDMMDSQDTYSLQVGEMIHNAFK